MLTTYIINATFANSITLKPQILTTVLVPESDSKGLIYSLLISFYSVILGIVLSTATCYLNLSPYIYMYICICPCSRLGRKSFFFFWRIFCFYLKYGIPKYCKNGIGWQHIAFEALRMYTHLVLNKQTPMFFYVPNLTREYRENTE